jgi:hypothetical protein
MPRVRTLGSDIRTTQGMRVHWGDYSKRDYSSWRQIAGYFDGDGAVYVSIRTYTLRIRIAFYDVWRPQLDSIKIFLRRKGIQTRPLRGQHKGQTVLWALTIGNPPDVRRIVRRILPFSCKKRGDLLVALNYLENRITADEAIRKLNQFTIEKRRSGYLRESDIPFNRADGTAIGRHKAIKKAVGANTVYVPRQIQERIRFDSEKLGSSLKSLSLKYGYGVHVIRRVLKESGFRP